MKYFSVTELKKKVSKKSVKMFKLAKMLIFINFMDQLGQTAE